MKAALRIPVLTNGNVRNAEELLASLRETKADGVMSAEVRRGPRRPHGTGGEHAPDTSNILPQNILNSPDTPSHPKHNQQTTQHAARPGAL